MSIGKKLTLTISVTLAVVFLILAALNAGSVRTNNTKLVEGILSRLEADNSATLAQLEANANSVAGELEEASATARLVILELYQNSFDTLITALGNQIFPMIESFDFEGPKSVAGKLMAANDAVTWIRLTTAENPKPGDILNFGEHTEGTGRLPFSKEIKGDFAYLKIDMQVSLQGMEGLTRVAAIFGKINQHNRQQLLRRFTLKAAGSQALAAATAPQASIGWSDLQAQADTAEPDADAMIKLD